MPKSKKPRSYRNHLGRFISRDTWNEAKAERAQRRLDHQAKPVKSPKLTRSKSIDRFFDKAYSDRNAPGFDNARKAAGVKWGKRDVAVRVRAKVEKRSIVASREYKTLKGAQGYLNKFKKRRATISWFGLSAREPDGTLFYYQSPGGNFERTATELAQANNPAGGTAKTDYRIREAVGGNDARITIYTLDVRPKAAPKPKKEASNAKQEKSRGNAPRSDKRSRGVKVRSGETGKPSRRRVGINAGAVRRESGVRQSAKSRKQDSSKGDRKPSGRTAKARSGQNRRG